MNYLKITSSLYPNLRTIFGITDSSKPNWTQLGLDSVQPQVYFKVNPSTGAKIQILAIADEEIINTNLSTWQTNASHWSMNATLAIIDEDTKDTAIAEFEASLLTE